MKITIQERKDAEDYMAQFCKIKEAADILGVTRNTAYARARAGLLDTVPVFVGTTAEERVFWRDQVMYLATKERKI